MAQWMLRVLWRLVFVSAIGLLFVILIQFPAYYGSQTTKYHPIKSREPSSPTTLAMVSNQSTQTEKLDINATTSSPVTMVTPYMITPRIKPKNSTDLGLNDREMESYLTDYSARCHKLSPKSKNNSTKPLCDCLPTTLVGRFNNSFPVNKLKDLQGKYHDIKRGGHWSPVNCTARERVTIIIPYMNRKTHLNILLNVLHPFLHRQQLDYRIFVAEQVAPDVFNKAATMNAAFLEANKLYESDCVIFHDVDMLPEDDRNMYTCSENSPRHLGAYIDKFGYTFAGLGITIGGVSAWKPSHFLAINGFSNLFYGWGGEDDDTATRLRVKGLRLFRGPPFLARYTMLPHNRDKVNPYNQKRRTILKASWYGNSSSYGYHKDGLNSVQYELMRMDFQPLYTRIQISVPLPPTDSAFLKVTDNLY